MEFQLPQIVSMTSSEGGNSIGDDVAYPPAPVGVPVVAGTVVDGEIVGPLSEPLERYLSKDLRKEVSRLKLRICRKGPDANDHKKGYIALIRAHMKQVQPMPAPQAVNNSQLWNAPQHAPTQRVRVPEPQPQMQMQMPMQMQSMHSRARPVPPQTVDDAKRAWMAAHYIPMQRLPQQDLQEYWPALSLPRPPPPPPRSQTPPPPPAPPSQSPPPPPPHNNLAFESPPLELPSLMPSDSDEEDEDDDEDDYEMESPQNENAQDAPTHMQSPQHLEPRELQFDDKPVDEPTNKPPCVFVTDSGSGSDFGSDMDSDSGDDSMDHGDSDASDDKPDPVVPGGGDVSESNIAFIVPTRPPRFVKKTTDVDLPASISPSPTTVLSEKATDATCEMVTMSPEPSVDDTNEKRVLSPAPRSASPNIGVLSPEIYDATREMTAPAKPSDDTQEMETASQEPIDDADKMDACRDDTHEMVVLTPEPPDDTHEKEAPISESCDNASEMEASSQESNDDDTSSQEASILDPSDSAHANEDPEPSADANTAESAVTEPPSQVVYPAHPLEVVIKHTQYWESRLTVSKRRIGELYGELQGADAQEEEEAGLLKDELKYYTRERKRALRSLLSDPVVT